jgi:uncharacterized protein YggE
MFRRPACALLLLPVLALALAAPAVAQDGDRGRVILVEGAGEVVTVPDMAILSAGVTTRANSAREAMAQNAEAMNRVMAALKAAGIADRAVRTSRLSVSPIYDRSRNSVPELRVPIAYQANNTVEVKAGDLDHVGALIDALVASGANQIQGIRFAISDPRPLEDKAREAAVADARAKAMLYAKAAGVKLGAVLSIEERSVRVPTPRLMAMEVARDTAIAPGEQSVRIGLAVRFAIE